MGPDDLEEQSVRSMVDEVVGESVPLEEIEDFDMPNDGQ